MKLNLYLISICLLVYLSCIQTVHSFETKPRTARTLCGDTFIKMWKRVCRYKASQIRHGGRKDTIMKDGSALMYKRRLPDVLPEKVARSFLVSKRVIKVTRNNPSEECCQESCTMGEIAEYPC